LPETKQTKVNQLLTFTGKKTKRIYVTLQISMAVCSILYQLATRPGEQEKIHEELVRVLPSADTPLTSRHLDQMQYLRAFVKEVFR